MTGMGKSLRHRLSSCLQNRRLIWLVSLGCVVTLACCLWVLAPAWRSSFPTVVSQAILRRIAIAFLYGLLIVYVAVLTMTILGMVIGAVLIARSRGAILRQPRFARLLLLNLSLVLSLAVLEASAAAWRVWLHRSPSPPNTQLQPVRSPQNQTGEFPPRAREIDGGPLRILVLGESSARGDPYHPWLSVGQILGWRLEQVFPGRPISVEIWAQGGATLEQMHQKLGELTYRPDVLLLISGHNEFQARYYYARNLSYYLDEHNLNAVNSLFDGLLRSSPICGLILETLGRQSVGLLPRPVVKRQVVDRPVCTEDERAALLADFRRRVESIAAYCESLGTLPIFIIPGSNDGDFEPNRSVLEPTADRGARDKFTLAFREARVLEKTSPMAAIAAYRALLRVAPGFAETHYRLARLLADAGEWGLAREHYVHAREADAFPMRCLKPFRQAYRDVAARHPGLILVDSTRVLEPLSPHGILDDHLFHDAQHPNLQGYLALAHDVLNQLHDRHALDWPAGTAAPGIDSAECAEHFGLDPERWAKVCERSADFYRVTAFLRHDPSVRLEHEQAYRRAAQSIASGKPPEQAGIVGLGVHAAPAS